jgi:hypothetical protein
MRMPKVGFEPTRAKAHYALNVARLPIPPLRRSIKILPRIKLLSTCHNVHSNPLPSSERLRPCRLPSSNFLDY